MPTVSVIVPIYNVEKHIEKCVTSLLNQTLEDIEYIFVDDCSTDNSVAILKETINKYPHRKEQAILLAHTYNKGLSATRNTGLSAAKGDYIAHCDSDDWVDGNMYKAMYECAVKNKSDIVYCDINMVTPKGTIIYETAPYSADKKKLVRDYIASNWTCLVTTLAKKSVYYNNDLSSPSHITYCEDFWLTVRLFHFASNISKVPQGLYYYNRLNETSILHSLNRKTVEDERRCYLETINFFHEQNVYQYYKKEICWRMIKSTYDSIFDIEHINDFMHTYPESHRYILSCPYVNVKSKILMWLLTHNMRSIAVFILKIRKALGR